MLACEDCTRNSGYSLKNPQSFYLCKDERSPASRHVARGGEGELAPGSLLRLQAASYLQLLLALSTLVLFFLFPLLCLLGPTGLEINAFRKDRGWEQTLDGGNVCVQDASTCVPPLRSPAAPTGPTIWEAACCNCFHETVSTG